MYLKNENDEVIVGIVENELIFKLDFWDIEFVGRRFTIRQQERNLTLDMRFNMPSEIIFDRAVFCNKGNKLAISDGRITTRTGGAIYDSVSVNSRYGLVYNSNEDFAPSSFFLTDW